MKKIGRYEIIEELGRGAMGVVYKASDPTIGRLVAIKVLSLEKPTDAGIPGVRDIFLREARAAGRLSHPGIVTIHDALEDPETKSSYIVMEFIPGRTLESILLANPSLGTEKSLEIIRQVAEALDYAHRNQIIHRDLKPANIIVTDDGRIKITDFGIAKIAAREGAVRTLAIMGTPSYMSPEQVSGGEVDARSDLFSMGILLYLMLAGEKPFAGDTAAVMFKIVYEDPVLPSLVNRHLTAGHDYLVLRCLAKDRTKRYATAREFLDDLEDVRQGRPPRSEAKVPVSELRAGERTLVSRRPYRALGEGSPRERKKSRRAVLGAIAGAPLVVLLGLGIWIILERRRPPPAPPSVVTPAASVPASVSENPPTADQSAPPATSVPATSSAGEVAVVVPTLAANKSAAPSPPSNAPGSRPSATRSKPKPASLLERTAESPSKGATATPVPSPEPSLSVVEPPAPKPAEPKPARAGRVVTLACRHELEEGKLSVSSGAAVILQAELKGKKKRGFLGIKGGYAGVLSRPITIPADASELTVHARSQDGSVDLIDKVAARPPAGSSDSLQVAISHERMTVKWAETSSPKK